MFILATSEKPLATAEPTNPFPIIPILAFIIIPYFSP
jgi:hypothetical protein